jgi:SAM-dependent methyltransferase
MGQLSHSGNSRPSGNPQHEGRMQRTRTTDIHQRVSEYYDVRLAQHGPTARGVDWNSPESQTLRFQQLLHVAEGHPVEPFSINDFGCGYGALAEYLQLRQSSFMYRGNDLSGAMIRAARKRFDNDSRCRFDQSPVPLELADYTIASGVFNVKLDLTPDTWLAYILETLSHLARASRRGFAFNLLTSYSDAERMRPTLYYGDPCFFFDYCKRHFTRHVALLHDYGLYEFTIIARLQSG